MLGSLFILLTQQTGVNSAFLVFGASAKTQ
jgi:hypothetical protein